MTEDLRETEMIVRIEVEEGRGMKTEITVQEDTVMTEMRGESTKMVKFHLTQITEMKNMREETTRQEEMVEPTETVGKDQNTERRDTSQRKTPVTIEIIVTTATGATVSEKREVNAGHLVRTDTTVKTKTDDLKKSFEAYEKYGSMCNIIISK